MPDLPHLIVTRPSPQAEAWVARLGALGRPASALPLLGIDAPTDPAPVQAAWQAVAAGRDAAGRPLAVVMFVSPSAVQRFFDLRPAGLAWPSGLLAAAPGLGTRDALAAAGVPAPALCSPAADGGRFDSEALWAVLQPLRDWTGRSVLVVRGEDGRDWLAEALRAEGAAVHFIEAYRRTAPVPTPAQRALLARALAQPADFCWLFSSSEAVGQLPALAPGADWAGAQALATHPRIAAAARALGLGRVAVVEPSAEAVAAALAPLVAGPAAGGRSIQSGRT